MKDIRYHISLYVIVPVISAGFALLSIIMCYNITVYYLKRGIDPIWPLFFWGTMIVIFTSICGLLIVSTILSPFERFFKKTERLGVIPSVDMATLKKDDIQGHNRLFDQVTEMLSKVESRQLFPRIIAQSRTMRGVFNHIVKVASTDSTVLILGETGTGKELVASSIHEHSFRREKPFMAINCAAIPKGLMESELFGYEKGAFTGAEAKKPGKFEIADGGTIFMDEIGDMPLETQAKVLRVLQDGQVERVGGLYPIKVDIRFVAATNKDLSSMVKAGRFREDLFFRLNVFSIQLPPLRERREDIPLLVDKFMKDLDKKINISTECMQILTAYDWPGNVRELKNAIESALVLADTNIRPNHLPVFITQGWKRKTGDPGGQKNKPDMEALIERRFQTFGLWEKLDVPKSGNIDQRIQELEKEIIIETLARTDGVQVEAAKILGIKERSFWHRIKKYNIDISKFKKNGNRQKMDESG